jgi:hypothetical protein
VVQGRADTSLDDMAVAVLLAEGKPELDAAMLLAVWNVAAE